MIFKKIITWVRSLRYFVIADPADNSVTLSHCLFRHMRDTVQGNDVPKVFVFRISTNGTFGFMLNPDIDKPTQLCDIQYNGKYRCIGFETLCPSVGLMFYEYGLPETGRVKLSVSVHRTIDGKIYYQFDRPNAKHIRTYPKG